MSSNNQEESENEDNQDIFNVIDQANIRVIDQANIRVDPIGIIGDNEVIKIFEAIE